MEYIAQHTTIPVPRVRDVFKTGKFTWIEMDYINGLPLLDVWPTLTQAERTSCIRQLKGYVDQLRALPPPHPQRVQAVDGGSSFDLRLLSTAWGPFDSIAAFNQCMGHEFALRRHPELQSMFDRVAGRHWRIVFAHGDLSPQNILWRDGRIVGIIDWSYSGWFPEYWEYTRTWLGTRGAGESFWEMFRDSVDAYPDELEIEQCLGQVLNHDP
ncbi:kinase-like protein [Amylostereum chailletii]|nr:kinase-like protein [Amylostereum chailletii]